MVSSRLGGAGSGGGSCQEAAAGVLEQLRAELCPLVEAVFQEIYEEAWEDVVSVRPPWRTPGQLMELLKKHWRAVFEVRQLRHEGVAHQASSHGLQTLFWVASWPAVSVSFIAVLSRHGINLVVRGLLLGVWTANCNSSPAGPVVWLRRHHLNLATCHVML